MGVSQGLRFLTKLPGLIQRVEAVQHEVMGMQDQDKGKALAPKIGTNTKLSSNLYALKTKIKAVDAAHHPKAAHHK